MRDNTIQHLCNLPASLQVGNFYVNRINKVEIETLSNLIHLGLGYNELTENDLGFLKDLNHLIHLDLSYNRIVNPNRALDFISLSPSLQSLILQGNPCVLFSSYRSFWLQSLPSLHILDGVPKGPDSCANESTLMQCILSISIAHASGEISCQMEEQVAPVETKKGSSDKKGDTKKGTLLNPGRMIEAEAFFIVSLWPALAPIATDYFPLNLEWTNQEDGIMHGCVSLSCTFSQILQIDPTVLLRDYLQSEFKREEVYLQGINYTKKVPHKIQKIL